MKKILITGSRGLIGSYLVRHLSGYKLTELPVRLEDDIEPYFKNQDFVIHLAAKKQRHTPEEIWQVNVEGTRKVASLALKYGCKLINISSNAIHNLESEYGQSKLAGERIIEEAVKSGLKAITIRPMTVYPSSFLSLFRDGEWYSIKKLVKDIENLLDYSSEYRVIELRENHNKYRVLKRIIYRVLRKIQKMYQGY